MEHMSPQTYRILKFVVVKFRLKSVLTLSMPLIITLYGCYNITVSLNVQAVNYLRKFLRDNVRDPTMLLPADDILLVGSWPQT